MVFALSRLRDVELETLKIALMPPDKTLIEPGLRAIVDAVESERGQPIVGEARQGECRAVPQSATVIDAGAVPVRRNPQRTPIRRQALPIVMGRVGVWYCQTPSRETLRGVWARGMTRRPAAPERARILFSCCLHDGDQRVA